MEVSEEGVARDCSTRLKSQKPPVQILPATPTSYIALNKLVNLSRPQFLQPFLQIKSEKLQESPGTKSITTVWGF